MGRRSNGSRTRSEQGVDMLDHLRRGPGMRRNEFLNHFAVAVDQIALRILNGAVGQVDLLFGIAGGLVGEGRTGEEVTVELFVLVYADAEDDQTSGAECPGELVQAGNFLDAGWAPGGPEIEEKEFAAEIVNGYGLAGVGGDGEIGGGVAGVHDGFVERVIERTAEGDEHEGQGSLEDTVS